MIIENKEHLKSIIRELGFLINEFADLIKINRRTFYQYTSGRRRIPDCLEFSVDMVIKNTRKLSKGSRPSKKRK